MAGYAGRRSLGATWLGTMAAEAMCHRFGGGRRRQVLGEQVSFKGIVLPCRMPMSFADSDRPKSPQGGGLSF